MTLGVVPGNIGFNFSFTCKPATNLRFSPRSESRSARTHARAIRCLVGLCHESEVVTQLQFERPLLFPHLGELLHVSGDFRVEHVLELFDVDYEAHVRIESAIETSGLGEDMSDCYLRLTFTLVASRMASTKRRRSPRISLVRSAGDVVRSQARSCL